MGEDRHFCIRALALGFELFVDTHYPAFHLYRSADCERLPSYKSSYWGDANIQGPIEYRTRKLTLSMVVRNEAQRYLRKVLEEHRKYIDEAVIIDDGSTDDSIQICREVLQGIPVHVVRNDMPKFSNEVKLRQQQWEETIKLNPDWILNLDADEMFENDFARHVKYMINYTDVDAFHFRLYDFWSADHYREDSYWNAHLTYRPFLIRYRENVDYNWKETPQHCGRFPINIWSLPYAKSEFRLQHLGWSDPQDRVNKYKRYMELDPDAKYGSKHQYLSILDTDPRLIQWVEKE